MILLLFLSKRITVFLVFSIISAISSIVTWLSIFMASTILSSSVCFTGTFTGTSFFESSSVKRNRNGYRGRSKIIRFSSVFSDDLRLPVPRLLDDVTLEENLHELLVHRMSFAGKEILFGHPVRYRAIGNDFKPVIVPIDCGRNAFYPLVVNHGVGPCFPESVLVKELFSLIK